MADDAERAAKAARAKAMLKKRQQQKAAIPPSPSTAPGQHDAPPEKPSGPTTTRSPRHKDASLLFGSSDTAVIDFGEFGVLAPARGPVSRPPAPSAPDPVLETKGAAVPSPIELHALVANQQRTITLLVNEKASLTAQLDRLEDLQNKYAESARLLDQQREHSETLISRLNLSEEQTRAAVARFGEVEGREREAKEKYREQNRELERARRAANELTTQLENCDRELKALKEQVEADDRVETLERSLMATQNRMEELEFQLSKLKQNLVSTTHERDGLAQELASSRASEYEYKQKSTTLEQKFAKAQQELATLSSSLEHSELARVGVETQLANNEAYISSVQQQLTHASSELASHARQLQDAQADIASAQRRAEYAELAQRSLQAENSGLLAQLEEVRPKVVELSNKSAEDKERIWETEKKVRRLELTVANLEAQIHVHTAVAIEAGTRFEAIEGERRREDQMHREELRTLQDAYASVAHELDKVKDYAAKLEKEKSEQHAAMLAEKREQELWKREAQARAADAAAAKSELHAQRDTDDDAIAIVERAQAEIDALRDQLALREDELTRLREEPTFSSSRPQSPSKGRQQSLSLSREVLSAVRQQHALDLSTAHTRIRALETDVFDSQAAVHAFQRRVATLEDELIQLRAHVPHAPRTPTPLLLRRSFNQEVGEDSRRHSLSSTRSHTPLLRPPIVARTVYEENLSAETRHKRQVSLSMLKARIESERAAALYASSPSFGGSPRLSLIHRLASVTIAEADETTQRKTDGQTPREEFDGRPCSAASDVPSQFVSDSIVAKERRPSHSLDASHVFRCHSCRGDLVVL